MNCDAYPNGHAMGSYRSSSLWPPTTFIHMEDPPLPPNRTLCCSHTPASPPMHTTSLLVLQKSEPITTYAKPMALIPPFVPTSCMQMGSTQPHYILTRCRNN
ncbi:hypothetical protein DEO72_LG2g1286 [Vigna unguiculata]|uniref:Uncharacterized protein n=1 Tax=Vigna unguiculata TaxID=3917 RepID=A0A4D6KU07_VIGUN|nr:hypothetical protein DEO72_LG2g1286 [Vigna unguiculata]